MSRTKKWKKPKEKKARDWHAVNAHFRKAGDMGDKRKEKSKGACRKWKHQRREEND